MRSASVVRTSLSALVVTATALLSIPVVAGPAAAAASPADDNASGVAGNHVTVDVNANDHFATDGSVDFEVVDQSDPTMSVDIVDSAAGTFQVTTDRVPTSLT